MKKWILEFDIDAKKDFLNLDGSQKPQVAKAIKKVQQNPLPDYEGGYGKPLGNKGGKDLHGLLKIKLRAEGLRIVYKLVRTDTQMLIVVVGVRDEEEVYELAARRRRKHGI